MHGGCARRGGPERIAWTTRSGTRNAGVVTFHRLDDNRSKLMLQLDYEPEGALENVADTIGVVSGRITADLNRFRSLSSHGLVRPAPGVARSTKAKPKSRAGGLVTANLVLDNVTRWSASA